MNIFQNGKGTFSMNLDLLQQKLGDSNSVMLRLLKPFGGGAKHLNFNASFM
jgi:hypothetical protein